MITDPSTRKAFADRALAQYEIEPHSVEFLQHSGAITYRVQDRKASQYLLRIYSSISDFIANSWTCPDDIRSEMAWLSHLHEEGSVSVQRPVRTREGDWIGLVDDELHERVPCALLGWIDGECDHDRQLTGAETEQCAIVLARLHQIWSEWSAPPEFSRPRYDTSYLRRALAEAEKHVGRNVIAEADFPLFQQSVDIICSLMDALGESAAHWGLIHGDFNAFNLVFHRGKVSPIDFSECGLGHYLMDVGHCMLRLGPKRQAFLENYASARCLPDNAQRLADAFCLAHIVHWLAFTSSLPDRYEKVARLVKQPTIEYCRKFLDGESFLCPDR